MKATSLKLQIPLLVALAAAAFFRLYDLAEPAFRADTILFYNITRQVDGAWTIMSQWLSLMGISAQLPFPMAFTEGFMNLFGLEPGHFTLRLPAVLWGLGAVAAAWALGLRLGGRATAFALALIAAFNPYLILTSREAYFYPPMVLGSFLLPVAAIDAVRGWRLRETVIPVRRIAVHLCGMFLMIYSQPSGWFAGLLLAGTSALFTVLHALRVPALRTRAMTLIGLSIVIGLPVLFADWGVPQLLKSSSAEMRSWAQRVFEGGPSLPQMLATSATAFFVGRGYFNAALTILLFGGGIWCLIRVARREPWLLVIPAILAVGMASFLVGREATGAGFYSRYMLAYLPLYLSLLVLGLRCCTDGIAARRPGWPAERAMHGAAILLALINLLPAWWCTQLSGKPTPYKLIRDWLDTNLPRGTLVITDRWLEPWNEMALYQPTNVTVTFTVPDEPYDQFLANRWRDSVQDFFSKFPDAAYMEIARNYWDRPATGRWAWPQQYFARQTTLTNTAALKLREYGLANREDYFAATTNRVLVNIYWNTADDLLARARAEGRDSLLLFGPDWGYAKPWQQTRSFTDYRVLQERATLRVFWLGDQPAQATLRLRAAAIGGNKIVNFAGIAAREFPANQLISVEIGPLALQPGETSIELRDAGRGAAAALFVESVELMVGR
ncbi:MAG TPA: hypothetical protein PKE12_01120 [Kiritimatiellia bacterium]|nr:hypothetical protein [Kiritimatiellia bacterium]